ncbi:MAG: response regulator [Alphaproteobacteria bacterium]|nr:response regulator [Alphaproteobacteria bacterium]
MNGHSISWSSYTMLIADDNSHFRWLMRSFLTKFGVGSIVEAGNGADALQVLHKTPVDVALVDIGMEPINGLWFVQMYKNDNEIMNRNMICLLVTGNATPENIKTALSSGVKDVISKPLSAKTLEDRLKRHLVRYPGRS